MSTYERLPLEGVTFDWELVGIFGLCLVGFILGAILLGLCRTSAREMPAPPEPERIDPRDLCSVLSCRERATTSIQGFGLCGQHAYERTGWGA